MDLLTLTLSPPANPLGMPHGAATFVNTCSGDNVDCDSGVSVPEVLAGEGSVSQEWGAVGVDADSWPGLSTCSTCRGRGAGQHGAGL